MPIQKPPGKNAMPTLSPLERKNAEILIVDSDSDQRNQFRQSLLALGFTTLSDASDHLAALEKLKQRHITHVIFQAKKTNMTAREFLTLALEYDTDLVAIPSSFQPSLDDVFNLLVVGAKGYIVMPLTQQALDDALLMATKGECISDAILYAKDRNEALASLVMTALDRLAVTLRQAQQFETAVREIPRAVGGMQRAVDIGRTFAKGGQEALQEAIIEFCATRSEGPATRLGRTRKRLEKRKQHTKEVTHEAEGSDEELSR